MFTETNEEVKSESKQGILRFDTFGSPVIFNLGGKNTYGTCVGFLWTLGLYGCLLGILAYYFQQFLDETNPKSTSTVLGLSEFP
jgi:hypothetical protein